MKTYLSDDKKIICGELDLSIYHPGYAGITLWVWLNCPRSLLRQISNENRGVSEQESRWALRDLFSQGPAESRQSDTEFQEFINQIQECDPALNNWIATQAAGMILHYYQFAAREGKQAI